ncbi:MAG: uncharacterized protein A8A55_0802 [Amphiamblys sp. WSBS2006]|nr:MAG: uncharacterized protein A8A55_0802 [Amphiamblys sp. WSBS2006]
MQTFSVFLATLSVCVGALDNSFAYVPKDILPRFQTEQDADIYILNEGEQPNTLSSVYFRHDARDKTVSLLRFVYDETEAKKRYPNTKDIAEEVAMFIADHAEVDTKRKLFFVSFANDVSPVQTVPEGVAEVSVLNVEESKIDYLYKKEREHGNIFDRFLVVEECKREDKGKIPRIKNFPAKRKEAILLLSFLAAKEIQLDLKTMSDIQRKGHKWGLKLPYGVCLFVSEENSCYLEPFDLTETRIKRLVVSSFDITKMDLKNTHIEELALVDEAALVFFYNSAERSEFYVEKFSFGNKLSPKNETFLKLVERIHEGETPAPKKIKKLVLSRNSFFGFLEETRNIFRRKIHVEDLAVTQRGKYTGPEKEKRIVVSKRINIVGSTCVLRFIEFGPELSHFDIDEIQTQCRSPEIKTARINMVLAENKIIVRENPHVLRFLKKNITATEMDFFAKNKTNIFNSTKITLVSGEMENICFRRKGLSVLPGITNEKINVRNMAVIDITCFSDEEKEEAKKKVFVIREGLYMRNTGILFLECLGNKVFIPVIEIEIDFCMEYWGGFEETVGTHVWTNALVENITPEIESVGEIKQKIGEMIKQKEIVVEKYFGYQKFVFKEDFKHREQSEIRESEEQPIREHQIPEVFKEYFKYEEQSKTGEFSEKLIRECQAFKEDYSLLGRTLGRYIPEENDWFQDEEVVDPFWNHFLEDRG